MHQDKDILAQNPLCSNTGFSQFDKVTPEHVVPAMQSVIKNATEQLETLEQNIEPTWDGLLKPLENMDIPFEYSWNVISHLMGVKNSEALRKAHEQVLGDLVQFSLRIKQSAALYQGLNTLRESETWQTLDEAQQRIIEQRLREAKHAGVGLSGEKKERFNEIAKELSQLSTDFSNHVLDATKSFELIITNPALTEGWPQTLRQIAAHSWNTTHAQDKKATPADGPWQITHDYPSYLPFMQHHRNREQREQVYKAFIMRASSGELDNSPIISRILKLRAEKAALLGFNNFAELSLDSKMAPDVAAVQKMSEELVLAAREPAEKELDELRELAQSSGQQDPLAHWDVAFWAERLREQRFQFTDEQLRPYFPLPRVIDGLFSLCTRLFGVTFESADGLAPVWHEDVKFYRVKDEHDATIAYFYLDPYSRPAEKRGGAWMDNCMTRRVVDGEIHHPVVHLCCNGTPPVDGRPSLMSFNEVTTLFHEFGHGLQGMLTKIDYVDAAGVNGIEWDAVEIASQFMENWCYHKPTLVGMTSHFETGAPLPDDLFDKICAARTYRAASMMIRQLEFGITDMVLHSEYDPESSVTPFEIHQQIARELSALPPLPESRFLCSFSHIFAGGYAAGYYSYKWAEVLDADAFAYFKEKGIFNKEVAKSFRDNILSKGGTEHPMDLYVKFRGKEPTIDALLERSGLK